ncbi:MAG: septum formation initiator family protein [Duncaniella sp.]|nr:septum formation initiator family protein [Duncaniella sp.]
MDRFLAWCRRYLSFTLLGAIAVAAFVMFFNENSVVDTYEAEKEIDRLTTEIRHELDTLNYYRRLNASLDTDRETMERIVREQHHMQHPNEDVYIFE